MKKVYKVLSAAGLLYLFLAVTPALAQGEDDIAEFMAAGAKDASKLLSAYMEPAVKSVSFGMTGGWYNTAKAHKTLGFDLSISASTAFIPSSENYFNPNKLNLSSTLVFTNDTRPGKGAPTVVGPGDKTTYTLQGDLDGNGTPDNIVTIDGPEGIDMKKTVGFAAAPVPMVQLGIGIVKNTDLKIRFVPKTTFGESNVQMFGVGVMHDVKQHIPGLKLLPFDLSALVAFNSVSGSSDLSNSATTATANSADGEMTYKFNSWVFQGIISKKVSVLTGYAGIGYTLINTNVNVDGTYNISADAGGNFSVVDPVDMDFKNKSLRLTAGMRLKFGPVFLVADYTVQKYNMLTVGLGVAVR